MPRRSIPRPPAIDLRSDTVTRPTRAMREAMAQAAVGDDVLEGDPTVRTLEERVAELLGKDDALLVPSGTMANLLAIKAQTHPGDELVVHEQAHIYHWETGGYAAVAGCSIALVPGPAGRFDPDDLESALRPDDAHCPPTRLVAIENTHNKAGGAVWPVEAIDAVAERTHALGLRLHVDGARLWNASVASGQPMARLVRDADSVSVCFSKGLGAPVGSALAADQATIDLARRWRKMLGGAMRQAGVIASAALYAMEHHVQRLAEDHARARRLAEGIARCAGMTLDPPEVATNIVYARLGAGRPLAEQRRLADGFVASMAERGVGLLAEGDGRVRAVLHLGIDDAQLERALEAWEACGQGVQRGVSRPAPTR
ncbi:MAG: threonine aldolase [Phycisphaerales bacterium]|nr:MAG: threonine aldolase [Phycisphaerales bacterium]